MGRAFTRGAGPGLRVDVGLWYRSGFRGDPAPGKQTINLRSDLRAQSYGCKPEEGRALCSSLASSVRNPAGLPTALGKGPQRNKGGGRLP